MSISSTLGTQYLLQALKGRLDQTQAQASSGKKSSSIADMGATGAGNAVKARADMKRLDSYTENLNAAQGRIKVMDSAIASVTEDARTMLTTLRQQLQSSTPQTAILSNQAKALLSSITDKLNAQVNGKYVFAGNDLYSAPFASNAALTTGIGGQTAGWMTGAVSQATILANARATSGTALGFGASLLTAGAVGFRASDNVNLDTTVLANNPGFADVLRGLAVVANMPAPTTTGQTTTYWNAINAAITMLDEGSRAVDVVQGNLGNTAKQVSNLLVQHSETSTVLEQMVGDIEDVDLVEVSTRLQNLQTQMQASYSILASLKDLSLTNYI